MSFDERYEEWERYETPEFLERVKGFRDELQKLKEITSRLTESLKGSAR